MLGIDFVDENARSCVDVVPQELLRKNQFGLGAVALQIFCYLTGRRSKSHNHAVEVRLQHAMRKADENTMTFVPGQVAQRLVLFASTESLMEWSMFGRVLKQPMPREWLAMLKLHSTLYGASVYQPKLSGQVRLQRETLSVQGVATSMKTDRYRGSLMYIV